MNRCCTCLIGVDIVDVERFTSWINKSHRQLSRIISPEEIMYCRSEPNRAAERFAGRFAAREALYKALAPLQKERHAPFLALCGATIITTTQRGVIVQIAKNFLDQWYFSDGYTSCSLSLSHTSSIAMAVVTVHINDLPSPHAMLSKPPASS